MTTRLKIDVASGLLEVEGEESFVSKIYDDFKDKLGSQPRAPGANQQDGGGAPKKSPAAGAAGKAGKETDQEQKKRGARKESFAIQKDLDLSGKGKGKGLREFFKEKAPATAMENNVVFAYYLSRTAGVAKIGLGHIYTCYKDAGQRVPTALRQSVLDTSFRKGWLETSSMDDVKVTTAGENFVEHDLPRKQVKK